jgi:hypothetical protein
MNVKALSHPEKGMGISNKDNSRCQQLHWNLKAG